MLILMLFIWLCLGRESLFCGFSCLFSSFRFRFIQENEKISEKKELQQKLSFVCMYVCVYHTLVCIHCCLAAFIFVSLDHAKFILATSQSKRKIAAQNACIFFFRLCVCMHVWSAPYNLTAKKSPMI